MRVLEPERWRERVNTPRLVSVLTALSGRRYGVPWGLLGAVSFLVIVSLWTRHAVNESLTTIVSEKLQTILDADVTALEIWIENERAFVDAWATDENVRETILKLRQIGVLSTEPAEVLLDSPLLATLQEQLDSIAVDDDILGFLVVDASGLVLATDERGEETIGLRPTPEGLSLISPMLNGDVAFLRPIARERVYRGPGPRTPPESLQAMQLNPYVAIGAHLRDEAGNVLAVLVFKLEPEHNFSRILKVARLGDTGETYAFDRNGFMLSNSRFEEQLAEIGIIPEDAPDGAAYAVQVRDPGGDMTKGFRPEVPLEALPLTKMAANAISGIDGMDFEGYRDYRGVKVIGAWRWMPRYDMGVTTEIDVAEAFRALRPLNIANWTLLGLLAAGVIVVMGSTYSLKIMSQRMEAVQQLGQYTLEEKLGEGGMGTVYRARHAMLRRPTALKMLKPEALSEENVVRFEREVQLTAQLSHPSIIEIYDYGRSPEGIFYYVMEFLSGLTLADLIELETAVPPPRVIFILKQVCSALEQAHAVGLVHRDIKPLNIMLCRQGVRTDVVKVLDFGLVKDVSTPEELQVTSPDIVGGTPPYIAPERLKNPRLANPRSDLFSVGVVAYNLLTGRSAFEGSTAMEICYQVLNSEPKPPSEVLGRPIPPKLEALVMQCLARDPEARPDSAGAIVGMLESMPEAWQWGRVEARTWWEANAARIGGAGGPGSPR